MPDAPTLEVKPADVLASIPHKAEKPLFATGATGEVKEAQDILTAATEKTAKINEAREKDPINFKANLEAAVVPPDFTDSQMGEIATALGVDIKTDGTITNELQPIAQYLEASRSALLKGSDITTELKEAKLNAEEIQKKVAEILINRGRLLEKFPILKVAFEGTANQDALNTFIEQAFARDPRFQKEMANVLTEIQNRAKGIESSGESEEKTKLEQQKEPLTTLQESFLNQITSAFGKRLNESQQAEVRKLIEVGADAQAVMSSLEIQLGMDDLFNKYKKYDDTYTQYESELNSLDQAYNSEPPVLKDNKGNERPNPQKENLRRQRTAAQTSMENAASMMASVQSSYQITHPEVNSYDLFLEKFNEHQNTKSLIDENGSVTKLIDSAVGNQERINALNEQIRQLGEGPKNAEVEKTKNDLIKQLEASVDTAMSKFLAEKYNNYISNQNILIDAAVKEAEKQQKTWKVGALKQIRLKMDKWRKFENGKFTRNSAEIGISAKSLAEQTAKGEDGVRNMIAETVGFQLDPEQLKDEIAKELIPLSSDYSSLSTEDKEKEDALRNYANLSPEDKIKADKIAELRTKEFEEIMSEQGENFQKTLFVELSAARGFKDRIGRGNLSLTNDEVEILNRQFGPMMEKTLENSSIFKELKKKGIIPNTKTKWAIYIAILLGLGIAAVGISPAAVAAAGAAKGIGGAAWSEGLV